MDKEQLATLRLQEASQLSLAYCDAPLLLCDSGGLRRCGCVGCPMAGRVGREKEFAIWPKFQRLYIHSFEKMLRARAEHCLENRTWKSGLDVYHWWMEDGVLPGQRSLFDATNPDDEPEMGGDNP